MQYEIDRTKFTFVKFVQIGECSYFYKIMVNICLH